MAYAGTAIHPQKSPAAPWPWTSLKRNLLQKGLGRHTRKFWDGSLTALPTPMNSPPQNTTSSLPNFAPSVKLHICVLKRYKSLKASSNLPLSAFVQPKEVLHILADAQCRHLKVIGQLLEGYRKQDLSSQARWEAFTVLASMSLWRTWWSPRHRQVAILGDALGIMEGRPNSARGAPR